MRSFCGRYELSAMLILATRLPHQWPQGKPENRQERIDQGLYLLAEILDKTLTDMVLDGYQKILSPYDVVVIENAFGAALGTMKWFPKPDELRNLIEANNGLVISIEAPAQQQWRIVLTAVRQYGARRRPKFADPVTEHLIKTQFTWSYLCGMLEQNEPWEQKRWCDAFDLAASIHEDLIKLGVPTKVHELLETVIKPI